jgi:hypothetical protein
VVEALWNTHGSDAVHWVGVDAGASAGADTAPWAPATTASAALGRERHSGYEDRDGEQGEDLS